MKGTKHIDVSGNNITPTGYGYFAKALQNPTVQNIYVTLKSVVGTKKEFYSPYLKQVLLEAQGSGVDIKNIVVDKSLIGSIKDNLTMSRKIVTSFIKCKLIPEIELPSIVKDCYIIAYSAHRLVKILNPMDTLLCVHESIEEGFNSDLGAKIAVRDLELLGEAEFINKLE